MDHTDNTLRAAIKALDEVVAPAVDPADPQASQQLRLVIDSLDFLRQRVRYLHDRERFNVRHHLALATSVVEDADACSPTVANGLRDAIASAEALYESADARTVDLEAASARLAGVVRTLVREAADVEPHVRGRIERRILEATRDRIEADRAWHAPQGFDPDPGSAQPIEEALALRRLG